MAARRRKSARPGRRAGMTFWEPESPAPTETKVSFIGEEIEQAIRRIEERGSDLPRVGRFAVRVATFSLKLCKQQIKLAIGCGGWGIKG